ncbi:STAS domain-containing protein [Cyclobacterium qasimii]|uniref:Anti-sigma factor antagonist n=2 Tax=Cyclobacterium qasimii TaxID=1350429 RepID=S7WEQ6_9BACT|nr:STAS domain-containing protein [Cyclobacterium qasimii]EPR65254.1 anti-sigma F factor antagonist (spoIIAA-2) [Cyclobacterium qasimii M12-11B]GEO21937.1 anti-sigma factor antagonist [Cyclobacterium qasimii]
MLTINKTGEEGYLIISLEGEVDASNSVELDEVIQEVINEDIKNILVNAHELQYISSAGLGVFMSYLEDFKEKNIQFIIYGLNEKVMNVFHILGLDQLMNIKDTREAAEKSLHEA